MNTPHAEGTPTNREGLRRFSRNEKSDGDLLMSNQEAPCPGAAQLDAILRFLPIFEQPGYRFTTLVEPPGRSAYYDHSPEVSDFIHACYQHNLMIVGFDWPSWQEEAWRYCREAQALQGADLLTLRRLITTHVRKDRFVGGHMVGMLESGHITAILRRLKEIRQQMGDLPPATRHEPDPGGEQATPGSHGV